MNAPFKDRRFYMHKNALDVLIYVIKVSYIRPNYVKMKVDYVNLGYVGKPYIMNHQNNFIINSNQYANWIHIKEDHLNILRTKSGNPLKSKETLDDIS